MGETIIGGAGAANELKVDSSNRALVFSTLSGAPLVDLSGTQPIEISYTANEQVVSTTGSPSASNHVFTSGTVKTILVKCDEDTYINFDADATANSFKVDADQSLAADLTVGSVSSLYKSAVGSIWIWGGR